jgi:hypothetical protein
MKRWLNTDEAFRSESELFRSDRIFSLWAHTVSHRQLLLRTAKGRDQRGRDQATRLDVLFKPVTAVKIRSLLDGLTIHRATPEEEARIRHDSGSIDFSPDERFLVLESGTGRDYVVCSIASLRHWRSAPGPLSGGRLPGYRLPALLRGRSKPVMELVAIDLP